MAREKTGLGPSIILLIVTITLGGWTTPARGACRISSSVCNADEINAIPVATFASPDSFLQLTPSAYSDFAIVTMPPFPRWDPRDPGGAEPLHELLSGEFMTAVSYNGMLPMWTELCPRYPEWKSDSTFVTEQAPIFPGDPDNDGFLEGWSSIVNPMLRIRVDYDLEDTGSGVAMGRGALGGATYKLSNRYVYHFRYTLENISTNTLSGVSFYQVAHVHPSNTETPTVDMVYDDTEYLVGAHVNYKFDLTATALNSGLIDGFPTGSEFRDHVGISTALMPADWGLGTYRGHLPGDNGLDPTTGSLKPVEGVHCDVEDDMLGNQTMLQQDEVGGAMKWTVGDLAPGEMWEVSVMFSYLSEAMGEPAPACLEIADTGGDPEIRMSRGSCSDQGISGGPYDVVKGSLTELSLAPGCGPSLNCVILRNLACVSYAHPWSRLTLGDDAHRLERMYYLARETAPFSIWGFGDAPDTGDPWIRIYATPTTSTGIDACQPPP
jgi:hypothetical protein